MNVRMSTATEIKGKGIRRNFDGTEYFVLTVDVAVPYSGIRQ